MKSKSRLFDDKPFDEIKAYRIIYCAFSWMSASPTGAPAEKPLQLRERRIDLDEALV
jgi:hypothetical protein